MLTAVSVALADEPPKSPKPPPGPPSAEIRLASGRVVSYRVPFNRNSLKSSARRDNHLIALTTSGALLRFDLPDVRLVRERVSAAAAACLGQGENGALLATDHGLRVFDRARSKLSKFDLKGGPSRYDVSALIRDGLGRLWIGGRGGLWLVEAGADGTVAEPFDSVPGIGKNEVEALAPDPRHEDGVIVALGENGVAFVRAPKQKPSR